MNRVSQSCGTQTCPQWKSQKKKEMSRKAHGDKMSKNFPKLMKNVNLQIQKS